MEVSCAMTTESTEAASTEAGSPPPAGSQPPQRFSILASVLRLRELSVVVVVIALFIYFGVANSAFISKDNFGNIADLTSATAIVAAGEVFLLVCGEIDLSAGMTFALAPFIMMDANDRGAPLLLALVIALIGCALIGLFNGLITQYLNLPSFITTLGTLYLLHGITLKVSDNFPRPAPTEGKFVYVFGGARWSEILWAIAICVVMQVVLTKTKMGTNTIATGANPLAAAEAGIRTKQIKVRAFMLTAVFAGFAGILDGIHISQSFDPNAGGNDLMFAAVAACVIGGTALLGGSGTVIGAFFGALLLGVLQDGFNIQGISATTFIIIEGVAILLAMFFNTQLLRFRRAAKTG
jgi:simple sugar transport system permease protein